jgi:hypothetical protein
MRRVSLQIHFGSLSAAQSLPGANNITTEIDYGSAFGSAAGGGVEAGVLLAPCLSVSLDVFSATFDGSERAGGVEIAGSYYDVKFNRWPVGWMLLVGRLKWPLMKSFSEMTRFSRAEISTGLIPFFRFGFGGSVLGALEAEATRVSDGAWQTRRVFSNTKRPALTFGLGVDLRWSWGGARFEMASTLLGRPNSVWPELASPQPLSATYYSFSLGFYI